MGNNLRGTVCLTGKRKIRVVLTRMMVPNWPGNVLLNVFLQSLRCMPYIPTVTVVHKLIYDIDMVMGS